MSIYVKESSTWRDIQQPYVKTSGTWRTITTQSVKDAGSWRTVFSSPVPGELWSWGGGSNGRLGNRLLTSMSTPVTTFAGGNNWKQSGPGDSASGAVKTDGTLWMWGSNSSGKLGTLGALDKRSTPVTTFAGGTNWADTATTNPEDLHTFFTSSSTNNSCVAAIKTDGTLWTWGNAANGRLGNANITSVFTPVTTFAGGTNWRQLGVDASHVAAIKTDGTLWVWGSGSSGRHGNGTTTGNISTPITTFAGGTDWRQVSNNIGTVAAIKTNGTLWIWGSTGSGGLGDARTAGGGSTPVTTFAGGINWRQVSVGRSFCGAVKTDGTLWMWGTNINNQLGINIAASNRSTPVTTFAGGTDWKQVSCGDSHTAAVKTDGTLWTWGINSALGALGNATTVTSSTPITTFAGGTNWKQVSAGYRGSAAVKTDGTLWVWGNSILGLLGNGNGATVGSTSTPITTFAGGTNWTQVSTGVEATFALQDIAGSRRLYCWGQNNPGTNSLAINLTRLEQYQLDGTNWKQLSSNSFHSVAVKTDGTLWCWGLNSNGNLGNNQSTTSEVPVTTFAGGNNWKQCSAGRDFVAAVKTDGTLWVWGNTDNGRLGNAITNGSISTPVTTFAGGNDWKEVKSGGGSTSGFCVAIKTDGTLWTWGVANRLGIAEAGSRATPITTFAGGTNWTQISSGENSAAAIKTDGTLWVWGVNTNLGLGTADTSVALVKSTPVTTFAGGNNWKKVSVGRNFTGAVKTDGTLWTWGYANTGRLGNAVISGNISTPITTFAGGTNWKDVSCGYAHMHAIG